MSTDCLRNGPAFCRPSVKIIEPLQFKLVGSDTVATAFPIFNSTDVPDSLIELMLEEFNLEIDGGQTYPQFERLTKQEFIDYWFASFCVIVLQTDKAVIEETSDWQSTLLGTFYIKPNYMARCSHNCNAGFLVNHRQRSRKIGYRLAQVYLSWAPLLGYKYSVFNLVFVTNTASWRIWDKFKFDRIGLVPKAAVLKGYEEPIDAIVYGKDLTRIEPDLLVMD
ncbi:hypothetical protein HG536_0A07640 [Torulaspora globosa]|uniref:N-acetyltransferase domain-containing protein n=1 Tax=Torulaspora globosa TaxID=48254 RepID=A0A7G3ZBR3_9SACH|nr:uncharacterized protein HG536_0A07640 [Torulaspora globosa]QLL30949.1 hypothetical protein HG536_0A07640 [Torulaspora globosa]